MIIKNFFDKNTFTLTYIVYDEQTKDAIIIDSVLDYDQASSSYHEEQVDLYDNFIKQHHLKLHYILETHAHADHLSGSKFLQKRYPQAKIGIGENIKIVQNTFKDVYNLDTLKADGSQFDRLFKEGETIQAGELVFQVINTPGHTPACVTYFFNNRALFTGDALFIEDFGTGRCDFPAGSARELYESVHGKLYQLSDDIKVYPGHDYQPGGRELRYETTLGAQKASNIQLTEETTKEQYIEFRTTRDAQLNAPKLLLPSIQINIAAGEIPPVEKNNRSYLKIPISRKTNG